MVYKWNLCLVFLLRLWVGDALAGNLSEKTRLWMDLYTGIYQLEDMDIEEELPLFRIARARGISNDELATQIGFVVTGTEINELDDCVAFREYLLWCLGILESTNSIPKLKEVIENYDDPHHTTAASSLLRITHVSQQTLTYLSSWMDEKAIRLEVYKVLYAHLNNRDIDPGEKKDMVRFLIDRAHSEHNYPRFLNQILQEHSPEYHESQVQKKLLGRVPPSVSVPRVLPLDEPHERNFLSADQAEGVAEERPRRKPFWTKVAVGIALVSSMGIWIAQGRRKRSPHTQRHLKGSR